MRDGGEIAELAVLFSLCARARVDLCAHSDI